MVEPRIHGHSAKVCLSLVIGGRSIALAQVGPGLCIARESFDDHEPTDAQLVIKVDDHVDTHDVFLTNGVRSDSKEIAFT